MKRANVNSFEKVMGNLRLNVFDHRLTCQRVVNEKFSTILTFTVIRKI